jgi:glycosyltransferase involved in cell wall biosynthesis
MFFESRDAGLRESRAALEPMCRRVEFQPIDKLRRPFGQHRTAIESLMSGDSYLMTWLRSADAERKLAQMASDRRYDLACFETVFGIGYRKLFPDALVTLNHHNIESHMLLRRAQNASNPVKSWYFGLEGKRLQRAEAQASAAVDLNFTCSELDSDRLRAIASGARCEAVPNGVDIEFFKPQGTPTRPHSLIFVGTMSWYPNIDAVLYLLREIFPLIRAARPSATLDIVGASAPPEVRSLAAATPGVTLHGFVPELRPLLDSAAVYVCPIRDGGGTKLKVLDAFAMEKCLVAHPIACEGIDVSSGHDVVFAEKPAEFRDRIIELFDNEPRRRTLGRHARELVSAKYSWDAIAGKMAKTLADLPRRR